MNKRIICVLVALAICVLAGCSNHKMGVFTEDMTSGSSVGHGTPNKNENDKNESNREETTSADAEANKLENEFIKTDDNEISEVMLNPNRSSYAYFRSLVNKNYTYDQLQKCSYGFKIEEFLNYFDFSYGNIVGGHMFGIGSDLFECPWNPETMLFRLTLGTQEARKIEPANFVFCIDVSESMARADVLPLFKEVFPKFVASLGDEDRVSIVSCTDPVDVIVDGKSNEDWYEIISAVGSLEVGNGANSALDLEAVYDVAKNNFIEGGNNRVVIVSDGDISGKLISVVKENAKEGIDTSVIGLGDGNHRNNKLEAFANAGNGRYFYIDCKSQGDRVMGDDIFRSVKCCAEDVVASIEFNSEYVSEYRLVGYVGQGEAGGQNQGSPTHQRIYEGDVITLCYELKFRQDLTLENSDFIKLQLEYRRLSDNAEVAESIPISVEPDTDDGDEDIRFMALVIESVMVLQRSEYIGKITLYDVLTELKKLDLEEYPNRDEFVALIDAIVNPVKK